MSVKVNRSDEASSCCGPDCCAAPPGHESSTAARSEDESASAAAPALETKPRPTDSESIREQVRAGYAAVATAERPSSCCGSATICGDPGALATSVGYAAEDLAAIPDGANMGLSCGNPTVIAALKPGEVVLDLGSGGGFDVFLAGPRVGAAGRAIGVDMTPEMLAKARRNMAAYERQSGLRNVEFRLGEIEHLPVADASIDVVISNCVINLSTDKPQVWREIARVLKPGGRVAVSDLALLKPLPPEVVSMIEAWIGCIACAVLVEETDRMAREAGLVDIQLTARPDYVAAMENFQDPLYRKLVEALPAGAHPADYITSLDFSAARPR